MSTAQLHLIMHVVLTFSVGTTIPMLGALVAARATRRLPAATRHQLLVAGAITGVLAPFVAWSGAYLVTPLKGIGALADVLVDLAVALGSAVGLARLFQHDSALWATVAFIWVAGTITILVRMWLGLRTIRGIVNGSDSTVSLPLALAMHEAGWPASASVRTAACATSFTFGCWPPVVVLPENAVDWELGTLSRVLTHELAHVARHDWITHVLVDLFCAVQWFNPLAWLLAREIRFASECACDDWVVGGGESPATYAGELVTLALGMRKPLARGAVALASATRFSDRIVALLDERRSHPRRAAGWKQVFIASILIAAIVGTTIEASNACRTIPGGARGSRTARG